MLLPKILSPNFRTMLLLVTTLALYSEAATYQESLILEDLESLFGEDDCLDGSLSVTEGGDPVIKSGAHVLSTYPTPSIIKTKGKNETLSDKSSISLVYELAEFNHINVQFTLIDEKGPSHKKQFVVSLKLGEEEYIGEEGSIKKAQYEASKLALNSTLYGHPPKRIKSTTVLDNKKTPVHKLDAWATKHDGATVVYSYFEQTRLEEGAHINYYHSGMYSKGQNIHKVNVRIGNKGFTGEGSSLEIAKQNAARFALKSLQNIDGFCMLSDKENSFFNKIFDSNSEASPISLVHEYGTISNIPVSFDLYSEEGPAHIKKFIFRCNVGDRFETFGEGSSKKIAKKQSAEEMVQELKRHATFNNINCSDNLKKGKSKKKKSRNLIKSVVKTHSEEEERSNADYLIPEELDPVSKLFQIQQARHEVLPVFTSLEKSKNQFNIEVSVNELTAIGSSPSKKIAKKKAAEAMLEKMGYSALRKKDQRSSQEKKKDFSGGQGMLSKKNIVPGLNLNSNNFQKIENSKESVQNNEKSKSEAKNEQSHKLKDKLGNTNMPQHKDSFEKKDLKSQSQKKSDLKPKSQLQSLSQQLGFKFQFSDFPKVNNSGFVSLVSLTTDPPKVCFGVGVTSELAQDKAALSALGTLYKSQLQHISQMLREEKTDSPVKTQITMVEEDDILRTGATRETDEF